MARSALLAVVSCRGEEELMKTKEWRITREELYLRLWSTPMKILADELDIWYSELIRVSDEFNVPRPPMGYLVEKAVRQRR